MGSAQSSAQKPPPQPKGLVLVPPLFERDHRGRSRMTGSSYDWMFCKPGLKWLFNDYMRQNEAFGIWRLRQAEMSLFLLPSTMTILRAFHNRGILAYSPFPSLIT